VNTASGPASAWVAPSASVHPRGTRRVILTTDGVDPDPVTAHDADEVIDVSSPFVRQHVVSGIAQIGPATSD